MIAKDVSIGKKYFQFLTKWGAEGSRPNNEKWISYPDPMKNLEALLDSKNAIQDHATFLPVMSNSKQTHNTITRSDYICTGRLEFDANKQSTK